MPHGQGVDFRCVLTCGWGQVEVLDAMKWKVEEESMGVIGEDEPLEVSEEQKAALTNPDAFDEDQIEALNLRFTTREDEALGRLKAKEEPEALENAEEEAATWGCFKTGDKVYSI